MVARGQQTEKKEWSGGKSQGGGGLKQEKAGNCFSQFPSTAALGGVGHVTLGQADSLTVLSSSLTMRLLLLLARITIDLLNSYFGTIT